MILHFGALCQPIGKQLIEQGYSLSEEKSERFQKIANAIIMLKIHGIIPSSVVLNAEKKLMKQIVETLQKSEP